MKEEKKYYYRDYANPENNVIVTSMVQIEKLSGVSARVISAGLREGHMYIDPGGRFYVDRVSVVKDDSKRRKGKVGNLVSSKGKRSDLT